MMDAFTLLSRENKLLSAEELKDKYQHYWSISSWRERFAYAYLELLLASNGLKDLRVVPTGIGTLSDERVDARFSSISNKYDFTVIDEKNREIIWIDVTGTSWLHRSLGGG